MGRRDALSAQEGGDSRAGFVRRYRRGQATLGQWPHPFTSALIRSLPPKRASRGQGPSPAEGPSRTVASGCTRNAGLVRAPHRLREIGASRACGHTLLVCGSSRASRSSGVAAARPRRRHPRREPRGNAPKPLTQQGWACRSLARPASRDPSLPGPALRRREAAR